MNNEATNQYEDSYSPKHEDTKIWTKQNAIWNKVEPPQEAKIRIMNLSCYAGNNHGIRQLHAEYYLILLNTHRKSHIYIYNYIYICRYACISCMYVCMYACLHVCMCIYAGMQVCMYACMFACMHVCMHEYIYAYAYMHVCMYACMHVCMHACMYACLHVYIYDPLTNTRVLPGRSNFIGGPGLSFENALLGPSTKLKSWQTHT